jgi:DHA3 family macrolide efflux protein-like MFS transporter
MYQHHQEGSKMPSENFTVDTLPAEPLSMRMVLGFPALRRMWYAQAVSVFGDFLALFAVIGVMTFKYSATPQQVIGVQIAYLLPIAVLGILAGVFVDRWPVKRTMVASDFIRAGLVLLLIPIHNVWGFYVVLAAISVVSSFFSPAQGVAIRSTVPLHGLRSANALMQQVMFIMRIVGPFVAASMVAWFGAMSCYILDSVSFLASGCLIASIVLATPERSAVVTAVEGRRAVVVVPDEQKTGLARIWLDMRQGASFIFHHAALLFVILALAAAMFVMGCFGPLIAIYVRDILHASVKMFGLASPLIGVGLLIGVTVLNAAAKRVSNSALVFGGLGGIAVGVGLMAGFTWVATTLLGCFLVGFSAAGVIVPTQTLIQEETPPELMGRVGSTVMSAMFSAQIGGLLLSGVLAETVGVRKTFALCTAMLVVLIAVGKIWMEPKDHPAAA